MQSQETTCQQPAGQSLTFLLTPFPWPPFTPGCFEDMGDTIVLVADWLIVLHPILLDSSAVCCPKSSAETAAAPADLDEEHEADLPRFLRFGTAPTTCANS